MWDVRAGKSSGVIPVAGEALNLAWTGDGRTIAVGNCDYVVSMIDVRKTAVAVESVSVSRTKKSDIEVYDIAFSRSGKHFMASTGNGTIEILEYPSLNHVHTLYGHTSYCYCLGTLRRGHECRPCCGGVVNLRVFGWLDLDRSGRYMLTGGADAVVALWDLEQLACVKVFPGFMEPIPGCRFMHDGAVSDHVGMVLQ